MPILGEDFAYGTTLWACATDALFGHLPWALVHAPTDRRQFWPGEIVRTATGIDMARLFIDCVNACDFGDRPADRATRMRVLGEHLVGLGDLPLEDFEDYARAQVARSTRRLEGLIEDSLERRGARPEYWANDARSYLRKLRQANREPDYVVPLDLRRHRPLDEAHRLSQKLVRELGRLVYWWPEIHEGARDLQDKGLRLSVPVS